MPDLKVNIDRFDPDTMSTPQAESFSVPFEPGMTVLSVMQYIQENSSPSLSFRWNCREGVCGTCAIRLDGKPVLACKTQIPETATEITIGPLKAFPVVKDLVVDFKKAWDRVKGVFPFFTPKMKSPVFQKMHEDDVRDTLEFRKCIECFICHDSCHSLLTADHAYIGPRFVIKARELDMHPLDVVNRNKDLDKAAGMQFCNVTRCCQDNCPQDINITTHGIIPVKESITDIHDLTKNFAEHILRWRHK